MSDAEGKAPPSDELTASEPFESAGFEVSSAGSITSSEKAEKEPELPDKRGNRVTRYLFQNFFSAYRRLFAVIFACNAAVLVGIVARRGGQLALADVGSATSANLMVCILFRQENFVNAVYEACTWRRLRGLPLWARRRLANVFHYGGCHSGCGVAAVAWYLVYTALATRDVVAQPRDADRTANAATSWVLVAMFAFILTGAHPRFRVRFHDAFEALHRFAGWTALATFWVHSMFAARVEAREARQPLARTLATSPNFFFLLVSTCCTLVSWARLRRREVFAEVLSDHATRLHFRYRGMKPFYGIKLSHRPLFEWHAFATIPADDGRGFSVVVSNAGDWTRHHIRNPPSHLWVRGYPLHGLLYTSRLFHRIVVVATGSGIGPCLSLFFADATPRRILWSTPHPHATYGDAVMQAVLRADPAAVIWNTREQGRPDMVAMTHRLVDEYDAEAVFIISNPKVTRKVVYGMKTRGVPAYGAIFDS